MPRILLFETVFYVLSIRYTKDIVLNNDFGLDDVKEAKTKSEIPKEKLVTA